MGPLVHPTNRVRFAACPSVRPERFPGICRRTHWGNGLKFCMLIYLGYLQNGLDYGHGLLIFLLLASLWLSEMCQILGFRAFPGEPIGEWPAILHADVFSPPSKLICLWSWSVDFSNFGGFFTYWNGSNLGFPGILLENPVRKWPEILHAGVSWAPSELIRLWSWFVHFSYLGTILDLVKRLKFWVFGHFLENAWREWPEILHVDVSWPPSELISLWWWSVDFFNFGAILT